MSKSCIPPVPVKAHIRSCPGDIKKEKDFLDSLIDDVEDLINAAVNDPWDLDEPEPEPKPEPKKEGPAPAPQPKPEPKKETVPEFKASSAGINKDLADRSHAFSSYDPETRARQEIEGFKAEVQSTYERLKKYAKTPAQQELLNEEMARFQAGLAAKENAVLAAKGRTASPMITGGSKFPTVRNQKALDAEMRRYEDLKEFEARAESRIKRDLKKLAVEEVGGDLAAMKIKLEKAKASQENHKKINAIIRKQKTDDDRIKVIVKEVGLSEDTARKLLKPDYMGRVGIPAYELTNNNANIRRMEQRVKELEAKENKPTAKLTFPGGEIIDNAEEDRIQIQHDKKPAQEVIDQLKAQGWRWSPSSGAWQRKRTENALYSAKKITGLI